MNPSTKLYCAIDNIFYWTVLITERDAYFSKRAAIHTDTELDILRDAIWVGLQQLKPLPSFLLPLEIYLPKFKRSREIIFSPIIDQEIQAILAHDYAPDAVQVKGFNRFSPMGRYMAQVKKAYALIPTAIFYLQASRVPCH